jgi:ABC-type Fe3+ transport system permease subunit
VPRAGLAIVAASLWVVVQTSTEITVTDLFQVRTFAEEVYTQMVIPEAGPGDAVHRATLLCLPVLLGMVLVVAGTAAGLLGGMPSRQRLLREPLTVPLGRFRWPAMVLVTAFAIALVGVPLGSLIWRAGSPLGGEWSLTYLLGRLRLIWSVEASLIAVSLGVALTTGFLATALALALSLAARGSFAYSGGLLLLAVLAWTMPGPLVGQGFRDLVDGLLTATGELAWLRRWLYDGPSPVPLVAVGVVRFFPCALAVVGPAVYSIPRGLLETARLDGLRPWSQLREVIVPLVRGAVGGSLLFVALLTLGELSASKRVSTPDMPSYAEALFTQMHYGIDADLAIRCLLLLAVMLPGVLVLSRWLTPTPTGASPAPRR